MSDSPLYDKFAAQFGEQQADAILSAALAHNNEVHNDPGSDHFRWAIAIVIGWECVSRFAEHHKITVSQDEFKQFVLDEADLGHHDGDVDYLGLFVGVYQEYIK